MTTARSLEALAAQAAEDIDVAMLIVTTRPESTLARYLVALWNARTARAGSDQ